MYKNKTKIGVIDKLKIYLIKILLFVNNGIVNTLIKMMFKKKGMPKKILIFRNGSIGDSICAIPAIMNIKKNFANSHIDILTSTGVVKNLVSIDKLLDPSYFESIINYDSQSLRNLSKLLKRNNYDLIIHLTQQGDGLLRCVRNIFYFRFLIGIKSGFGWSISVINIFKKTQNQFIIFKDERTRLNNLLVNQYGLKIFYKDEFSFFITQNDKNIVEKLYQEKIKNKSLKSIAIVIGAKRLSNRWPISYFRELIEEFACLYNIIIVGGKEDAILAESLIDISNTYSFCDLITPLQSGILFQKCILTISNDTGPMHLSYAFGTPVVSIFSNRDYPYLWYPPLNGKNIVHRAKDIDCCVCLSETCFNDYLCMKKIQPKEVIESVNKLLNLITK
jgi:ADP-heptose:LPS heptosyltransferase